MALNDKEQLVTQCVSVRTNLLIEIVLSFLLIANTRTTFLSGTD